MNLKTSVLRYAMLLTIVGSVASMSHAAGLTTGGVLTGVSTVSGLVYAKGQDTPPAKTSKELQEEHKHLINLMTKMASDLKASLTTLDKQQDSQLAELDKQMKQGKLKPKEYAAQVAQVFDQTKGKEDELFTKYMADLEPVTKQMADNIDQQKAMKP